MLPASVVKTPYGAADGKNVDLYTLTNQNGLVLKVMTYGAAITNLWVPDRAGSLADVVLGFDQLAGYRGDNPYFGATVGRVANRIRDARFQLDGKEHKVAANNPPHHLHGGVKGWDKVVWDGEGVMTPAGPVVKLRYLSKDGEEGYPGNVTTQVHYALTNNNQLLVTMTATTDQTTLVNLAHHGYFNLGGEGSGTILEHELLLHAARFTPGDPMVPTGEVKAVQGTPFDFTTAKPIGRDLRATAGDPIGYDHNFVVDGEPTALRPVARVRDPKSGRVMTVDADQPGVQFYSGNFLDGSITGKNGHVYAQHTGFCLETQKFPNAINVPAWQSQVILKPGQTTTHHMVITFTAE